MRTRILAPVLAGVTLWSGTASAAEAVKLVEPATDERVFRVSVKMEVSGKLEVPTREEKPRTSSLTGKAEFAYEERRLTGTGREAEAFRSVRHYDQAKAQIRTGDFDAARTLRKDRRTIVSEGRREGARQFSPAGPLTYDEVDLLQFPGDTVKLWSLLPDRAIEPGEIWKPSDWVLQYLAGVEATEKTAINCKLESVTDGVARVEITGEVRGADVGARCLLKVSGFLLYDLAGRYVTRAEITHEDTREAGVLHPAFALTAKSVIERRPVDKPLWLTAESLTGQSLDPNPGALMLVFEQPDWGIAFHYDRQWHVFHQTAQSAVLRMMSQGTVVAQFQVSPAPPAAAGKHVPPEKFKADIQKSLGANFQQFVQDEEIQTSGKLFHYRVITAGGVQRTVPRKTSAKNSAKTSTVGQTKEKDDPAAAEVEVQFVPFQWMFNLLAAPDGRQAVLTFVVEADQLERFQAQDSAILGNFDFLPGK